MEIAGKSPFFYKRCIFNPGEFFLLSCWFSGCRQRHTCKASAGESPPFGVPTLMDLHHGMRRMKPYFLGRFSIGLDIFLTFQIPTQATFLVDRKGVVKDVRQPQNQRPYILVKNPHLCCCNWMKPVNKNEQFPDFITSLLQIVMYHEDH